MFWIYVKCKNCGDDCYYGTEFLKECPWCGNSLSGVRRAKAEDITAMLDRDNVKQREKVKKRVESLLGKK